MPIRIAIMQPYFFPYAGYYRLFSASDVFVVLDCVQFPRRGWVHRNQLIDAAGSLQWLTLPLRKASRDSTRICDLEFQPGSDGFMLHQGRRFPALGTVCARYPNLGQMLLRTDGRPVDYLSSNLRLVANLLNMSIPMVRSSEMNLDAELRGQQRILEIVRQLGGRDYINAPGGRRLYDPIEFKRAGVSLGFLTEFAGKSYSLLERLAQEPLEDLSEEIRQQSKVERY